jgi:bifunctional UDP-N-acetylglucosamine pyrophosphorylase/glucosamine-1-phosphate N-acetyltransferase
MNTQSSLSVIILAAGKGTRMKSEKAKVLHEVFFMPMVHHVIGATASLMPQKTVVVVGHQQDAVRSALADFQVTYAVQKEQLGTGHAVLVTEKSISENDSTVLILCGDTPLIKSDTLVDMCSKHATNDASLTLMTTLLEDPTNYGRIVSGDKGEVVGIVEQKDATIDQLKIQEINAGIYCASREFLFHALKQVGTENSQGEVYLTDIVGLAVADGLKVEKYTTPYPMDVLGVNSRIELAQAHLELQMRKNREIMLEGVTIYSPHTTTISEGSSVGRDSTLFAGVEITDNSIIGKSCTIGQGVILKNCTIGDNVTIGPYCCLTDITISTKTVVAPYTNRISSVL